MLIDYDLLREIMKTVVKRGYEEENCVVAHMNPVKIDGYDEDTIYYHLRYLCESGLMVGFDLPGLSKETWVAQRLTVAGHEFLQAMHSDLVWEKAKEVVLAATGTMSVAALKVGVNRVMVDLIEKAKVE